MNPGPQHKKYLPIFLDSENLGILIYGGGKNALNILKSIESDYKNARIKVVCNVISPEIKMLAGHAVEIAERKIEEEDLLGVHLVFVTSRKSENYPTLKIWAEKHRALLHIRKAPEYSNFQPGTSVDKGHLKLAFYAGNVADGISERLRKTFGEMVPDEMDELLGNFAEIGQQDNKDFRKKVSAINKFSKEVSKTGDYVDPFSALETTTKYVKAAQLKANIYLAAIGVMVVIGIFLLTLYEFNLFADVRGFLVKDHYIFLWMLFVGFLAEMIAGSMGMGYGVICTTILLLLNIPPPIVSASIHSAESFTTFAGSVSHFKLRNVNIKLVRNLAPFAILGAVLGAASITYFGEHYAQVIKPIIALYTLSIGINILRKSLTKNPPHKSQRKKSNLPFLGVAGGFIDSFAGGGWGPLVTGSLIKDGRTPRYVVGSSTVAKFLLTVSSAATFIYTMGVHHWNIVLGLLAGGIVTAPFSAMLTAKLPVRKMTVGISILVIIMSCITIYKAIFH